MSVHPVNDIGAHVKTVVGAKPTTAAATVNGAFIDRQGYQSCVLAAQAGTATGTPTGQTVDAKLQDSADGSTGWGDLTGAAVTQITADDTLEKIDVDLAVAKRYIRVVQVITLTGGSTPTLPNSSTVTLGGAQVLPAA